VFSKHTRGKRGHPEPAHGSKALAKLKAYVLREIKRKHLSEEKRLEALRSKANGGGKPKRKVPKGKGFRP
jgi:hypothetical protein